MTPPVGWSVATAFVVSAEPTFWRQSDTVAASPGSRAPLPEPQLSATTVAAPATTTGCGTAVAFETTRA